MTRPREREFPKSVKVAAFTRAAGRCEVCTAKLMIGRIHYDHHLPLALGGTGMIENCRVLCAPCHNAKTVGEDVPRIAAGNRARDAHIGAKNRRGRPMMGSRASPLGKRMDGTVFRRRKK